MARLPICVGLLLVALGGIDGSNSWNGALAGQSLDIVVRTDAPFVMRNVVGPTGAVLTGNERYTGYCVESIKAAAAELGFSYTLFEPSDVSQASLDGTYNQGHLDVVSSLRDVYWSGYFITTDRQSAVNFTTPYMHSGLSLVGLRPQYSESQFDRMTLIFRPFTSSLWYTLFGLTGFVALVFFVIERGEGDDFNELVDRAQPKELSREGLGGFFQNLLVQYPKSLYYSLNTFPASHVHTPKSNIGRMYSSVWVIFCLIIVSVYTANLAAFLTQQKVEGQIDSIPSLIQHEKSACTLKGTAYSNFLKGAHPGLRVIEKGESII
jgi:hypothetical protein